MQIRPSIPYSNVHRSSRIQAQTPPAPQFGKMVDFAIVEHGSDFAGFQAKSENTLKELKARNPNISQIFTEVTPFHKIYDKTLITAYDQPLANDPDFKKFGERVLDKIKTFTDINQVIGLIDDIKNGR